VIYFFAYILKPQGGYYLAIAIISCIKCAIPVVLGLIVFVIAILTYSFKQVEESKSALASNMKRIKKKIVSGLSQIEGIDDV